jgi:hypothetical protein
MGDNNQLNWEFVPLNHFDEIRVDLDLVII